MKILIVVDMLNDFVHPDGNLFFKEGGDVVPYVRDRIEAYRGDTDGAVIYVCDAHSETDKEFKRFPPHAIAGTWGAAIVNECEDVYGDHVFDKTRFSGFFKTPLEAFLWATDEWHGLDSVEVVGVCTSICVMDTVAGLANRDVENIIVPRAGVADFDPEMHEFALKRMERLYGAKIV